MDEQEFRALYRKVRSEERKKKGKKGKKLEDREKMVVLGESLLEANEYIGGVIDDNGNFPGLVFFVEEDDLVDEEYDEYFRIGGRKVEIPRPEEKAIEIQKEYKKTCKRMEKRHEDEIFDNFIEMPQGAIGTKGDSAARYQGTKKMYDTLKPIRQMIDLMSNEGSDAIDLSEMIEVLTTMMAECQRTMYEETLLAQFTLSAGEDNIPKNFLVPVIRSRTTELEKRKTVREEIKRRQGAKKIEMERRSARATQDALQALSQERLEHSRFGNSSVADRGSRFGGYDRGRGRGLRGRPRGGGEEGLRNERNEQRNP